MPKSKSMKKSGGMLGISSAGAIKLAHAQKRAGVPPFTYASLVFPIAFSSSSTTGNVWYWQWRLNSLYDPDFTGGGAQPTTFDQWMALYDRYRVIACEVELSCGNLTATASRFAFAPSQDAVPTLTFPGIAGMRDACIGKQPYPTHSLIKRTYLMKDVFGVDEEAIMSELNYTGTSSGSAASVAYGSLAAWTYGATDPVTVTGVLRFAVRFENPHANNVSLRSPLPTHGAALVSTTSTSTSGERMQPTELRQCAPQSGDKQREINIPFPDEGGFVKIVGPPPPPKTKEEELAEERALLEREVRAVRARLATIQSEQAGLK